MSDGRMSNGLVELQPDVHMTPAQVERYLTLLSNEVKTAQEQLVDARDRELEAMKIYTESRDLLLLSDACPSVGRNKGQITSDGLDAWIRARIGDEFWIYETVKVERANAESYVWAIKDQMEILRSLGVLARQAMDMTGRTR